MVRQGLYKSLRDPALWLFGSNSCPDQQPFCLPQRQRGSSIAWSFYHYDPTLAGATIALIFYGASTGFHVFQLWKFKCYFFTTFIVGAISKDLECGTAFYLLSY
jgi:hypothetical protein